jgi:tRNA nucleotidyltransferase (CCA-adding enzyme)
MPDLLVLKKADTLGQSEYQREEKLAYVEEVVRLWTEICEKEEAVSVKDLVINGNDLIGLGMRKGPELGEFLKECLEQVLDDPSKNNREYLLAEAKRRIGA